MPRSKMIAKKTQASKPDSKKKLHAQKIERKSAPVSTGIKKRRFKPGALALKEIKRYQRSSEMLIRRAPFQCRGSSFPTQCGPSSSD